VKGLVVLTVVKPIRVTHLTVALHGFVRVFKSASVRSGGHDRDSLLPPAGNGGKSQSSGNGQASLFQDEITLCGEGRLEIGVYEFEFELEFPNKCLPTSIDVSSLCVFNQLSYVF
jgi:arrestin-related trafficking adapter 9